MSELSEKKDRRLMFERDGRERDEKERSEKMIIPCSGRVRRAAGTFRNKENTNYIDMTVAYV